MNRRGFLSAMIKGAAGAMLLPPALTHARNWKRSSSGLWTTGNIGIRRLIFNWTQTSRLTLCYDDAYLDALAGFVHPATPGELPSPAFFAAYPNLDECSWDA